MWWPPDSDVVATTSLCGAHHILTQEEQRMPHTSLSGGHHILSGGHQIICGGHQIAM